MSRISDAVKRKPRNTHETPAPSDDSLDLIRAVAKAVKRSPSWSPPEDRPKPKAGTVRQKANTNSPQGQLKHRQSPEDGLRPSELEQVQEFQTVKGWKTMVENMKQVPQIIQDLLPDEKGGYGVIAGRTGIGKTNLILHLAHCLATGTPFFGSECQKISVAVAAFEGDPYNLRDRLNKIGLSFPSAGNRLRFEIMPIQNPAQMLKDVMVKLRITHDVRLVILDPIKYLVPGDYLNPKDVTPFIQAFREMLTDLEMSAIITLPISKPQDSKGLIRPGNVYSIKGATEWVDSATFCLLVEKKAYAQGNDEVTMSYAKHRIASKELDDKHLLFDRDACMYKPAIEVDYPIISMRETKK